MTFSELRAAVDAQIEQQPRLHDCRHELTDEDSSWTRDMEVATIMAEGSTGVLVKYASNGRIMHSRVFALSRMSIERITTTIAEHLTSYHRP